jgi:hypothetical protein
MQLAQMCLYGQGTKDLMREKELHEQSRSERTSVEIHILGEQEFKLFKTYCKGS